MNQVIIENILNNLEESQYICLICKEKYLAYHYGTKDKWVLRGIEVKSKEYADTFNKTTYHCYSCGNDFTITKLNYIDDNGNVIANTNPYFELHFNDINNNKNY